MSFVPVVFALRAHCGRHARSPGRTEPPPSQLSTTMIGDCSLMLHHDVIMAPETSPTLPADTNHGTLSFRFARLADQSSGNRKSRK